MGRSIVVAVCSTDVERFVRAVARQRVPSARLTKAACGREALVGALQGPHDLIVLDANLPDMGGIEVARRLRRQAISTPIVLVVPEVDRTLSLRARQTGIQGLLPTPLDYGAVVSVLRDFVQGKRRPGSPAAQ